MQGTRPKLYWRRCIKNERGSVMKSHHGLRKASRNDCLWTQFAVPFSANVKTLLLLWVKGNLKWSENNQQTVLWSGGLKSEIVFGKHSCRILKTKRRKTIWLVLNTQTPVSLMVWRYISVYRVSCLHI